MTKPKGLIALDILTGVMLLAASIAVLFMAPIEATMGAVQKVFYFHVAAGWTGMLGFLLAAVSGVIYLIRKGSAWDRIGLAGVEIGLVFMLINIITGSIWARPIWNTWWTWDPRLTTATIMELAYVAYLMLRQGIEDPEKRARFSAVYAILAFVSVPLTFFSIRISRTIHPVIIGSGDPSATPMNMTSDMSLIFIFSLITFSFIFADVLWHRLRLAELNERVEKMKLQQKWMR